MSDYEGAYATVVSLYNDDIGPEHKPGVHPDNWFVVPAATEDELGILVVRDGWHDVPLLDYKTTRMSIPAHEIARAISEDWKVAQVMADGVAMPGVFHVHGEHDDESVKDDFSNKIDIAKEQHIHWCTRLIKMADDLWQVSRQHRHIATTMINAAKFLKQEREWASDFKPVETTKCIACLSILDYGAIVCKHCGVIVDKDRFAELDLVRR